MGNKKSKVVRKVSNVKQRIVHSRHGTAKLQKTLVRRVQNVHLIWLDQNIDDNDADCRNTISELRQVVNDINMFTDGEQCVKFIDKTTDTKACIIISGSLGQHIVPQIHNMSQVDSIFIFCGNKEYHELWTTSWTKIRGTFTEISPICQALTQAAQECEQDAISISFMTNDGDTICKRNIDKLDPNFMYSQILKEILLTIKFGNEHVQEYSKYCNTVFDGNDARLNKVNTLKSEYYMRTPIWWYTWESFLYPMLNRSLRVMDMDLIIKMGFFITDLHRHIEDLYADQLFGNNSHKIFTVYRGQGMSTTEFGKMRDTQGGLMSFNNFLSTSKNRQVSLNFAHRALRNMDMVGILFVMVIDPDKSTTPFASTADVGCGGDEEEEVLFSMHTVFRIDEITHMDENPRLFQVKLTLTSDNDKDLRVLTDHIREESHPEEEGWYRLGLLLLKVGEPVKAQQIYERLLEQTTDIYERARIYHLLGLTKYNQGEHEEAITFYERTLEIYKKTLPPIDLSLASSYNNIGAVYDNMGDYTKALSYYEKDLEISKQTLHSNHPDLAKSYNNIGAVFYNMGDYSKALSYYEKALEIRKESLPANHPDLATSYNNIGLVHGKMGNHSNALVSHEQAFEIRKQSLPSHHPDLTSSCNNIGEVYRKMGNYSRALPYHEKVLEIRKELLPANHPDLAFSYNHIGEVYRKLNDYPKALSSYKRALEIKKQLLPPNHSDLARCYNSIGKVYFNMDNYPKALVYFEKALEIRKQSLPSNHLDLAISYGHIGKLYDIIGESPKALQYCQRAVDIATQSLPSNHPHLQWYKTNLDRVKKKL